MNTKTSVIHVCRFPLASQRSPTSALRRKFHSFAPVDLDIGETQDVQLSDGAAAKVKLLRVTETRDTAR